MSSQKRMLIGIIADRETTICFLLSGIGEQNGEEKNFLIVEDGITDEQIFKFFDELYSRNDISVILIGHDVALRIDRVLKTCEKDLPIIMKIPSKSYLEKMNEQTPFGSQNVEEMSDIFQF